MDYDGHLILRCNHGNQLQWSTGVYNFNPGDGLIFQDDGNLVIYELGGGVKFDAGMGGTAADHLRVQDDGNLVLYGPDGHAFWSQSGSGC